MPSSSSAAPSRGAAGAAPVSTNAARPTVHDEVARGQARADVVRIDQVHAIAHRDGVGPGACRGINSNGNRGHEGGRVVDTLYL